MGRCVPRLEDRLAGTGIADAHGAVVYQTTDGGSTWSRKVLSAAAGDAGIQIQFIDDNNGWATVANLLNGGGSFLRTTDGGNTWNPIKATSKAGGIYYYVAGGSTGVAERMARGSAENRITIFPNPAHGFISIACGNDAAQQKVAMYDICGVRIYSAFLNRQSSNRIDLTGYSKGIYFVKISGGSRTHMEKVVVQ